MPLSTPAPIDLTLANVNSYLLTVRLQPDSTLIRREITPISLFQVLSILFGGYGLLVNIGEFFLSRYIGFQWSNQVVKKMYMYSRRRKTAVPASCCTQNEGSTQDQIKFEEDKHEGGDRESVERNQSNAQELRTSLLSQEQVRIQSIISQSSGTDREENETNLKQQKKLF